MIPNLINTQPLTMSSREMAELCQKRHDNVRRTICALAERGAIEFPQIEGIKTATKSSFEYRVSKRDSYVVVAQLSPELTARLVDRWQELESKQAPALPQTYLQALQALVIAERTRQEAIRTKAEIGSRREATAMNAASTLSKKVKKLEVELGQSHQYATIKRIEKLYPKLKLNWRLLKESSLSLGLLPVDVEDINYGQVKAYHRKVWLAVYQIEI
jgi:phage regulator Rha-like protein